MSLLLVLKIAGVIAVLFGAGVTTSYAEYKFQYSLYESVKALLKKL